MNILFDSSTIVEIDRGNKKLIKTMKKQLEKQNFFISTVTVSEILTGAYRSGNLKEARKVLGQFEWVSLDGAIADRTAELMADLYDEGKPIEFQDVAITATAETREVDMIVTDNKQHFSNPDTNIEIMDTEEFVERFN